MENYLEANLFPFLGPVAFFVLKIQHFRIFILRDTRTVAATKLYGLKNCLSLWFLASEKKALSSQTEFQRFLLIYGRHIGFLRRKPTWRLHTKPLKSHDTFSQITQRRCTDTDLRLEKLVYLFVFYNTSFSRLLSLNGFGFYFLLRDSAYAL